MYVKRIRLESYGPIAKLDIVLPFDGDRPKPVVLVGENGSGKSIVVSHIVNGMIEAKHTAYPGSREVDEGKVFKIRDGNYIAMGSAYCFGRVDFEQDQLIEELILQQTKQSDSAPAMQGGTAAESLWHSVHEGRADSYRTSFDASQPATGTVAFQLVSENCLLYLPADRFAEPAWLNQDSLRA